jgi:hypothetical protein
MTTVESSPRNGPLLKRFPVQETEGPSNQPKTSSAEENRNGTAADHLRRTTKDPGLALLPFS